MQVTRDTTILGQVKEAIMTYASNNQAISAIILTPVEMKAFMSSSEFDHEVAIDSHYGALVVPVPTKIEQVRGDVVSCFYQGIRIQAPATDPVIS